MASGPKVETRFELDPAGIAELAREPESENYALEAARVGARSAHRVSKGWENESGRSVGVFYRPKRGPEQGEAQIVVGGFWHLPEFGTSTTGAWHPLQRGLESAGIEFKYGRG